MKFNEYIEYVKETCLEIGEEKGFQKGEQSGFQLGEAKTRLAVVTNMLHQGKSKKDIQIALGLTTSQVSELIRNVQNNEQV